MKRCIGLSGSPDPALASSFSRIAFAVFLPSPSAEHFHARLILSYACPLLQSISSYSRPGADVRAPSLGFPPSSRRHSAESTPAGVPSPLRSVLDVSHVLDGLLLCQTLRVYFAPQPRPGFALQGFPLASSRTGSSPAVALMSLALSPCSRLPDSSRTPRPPSGLCSTRQSVAEHGGLDRALLAPLLSFRLLRVFLHTPWSNFHRPSDHGLSRPPSYQQRMT